MTTPNEIEHEQQLINRGRKAALDAIHKAEDLSYYSSTQAGRYTLQAWMPVFIHALETITANSEAACDAGKAYNKNFLRCCSEVRSYIELCSVEVLSLITLKVIEDSYTHGRDFVTAQNLAAAIGDKVEHEVLVRWWDVKDPEIGSIARRNAAMPGSTPKYRKRKTKNAIRKKAKAKGLREPDVWSYTHRCLIGSYMLEVAREAQVCTWRNVRLPNNKLQKIIELTNEFETMLLSYERQVIDNAFVTHPLIDTPLDWMATEEPACFNKSGGYHLPQLRHKQPMCRGKGIHESVFGAKSVDLQNTLQRTAWRVDGRVLAVAIKISNHYPQLAPIGKFRVPTEDRPPKGGAPQHVIDDPELLKEWRRERAMKHQQYNDEYRRCLRTRKAIGIAKEYEHKTFYHSWFVDWRGRFYTQQSWLHPQGSDFEKSLIRFRDGCRLTDVSMPWIYAAIGKAKLGSRCSIHQRQAWTANNQPLINAIAEDPIRNHKDWTDADEPWTFLQLCFEWHSVVKQKADKFWKVPIEVDATASGLQLLSAIRRDALGMKCVNLLPPESDDAPPEDAYLRVLDVAAQLAPTKTKWHSLERYLKYREVGKPVVMTAIYGAKNKTFKERIEAALVKADDCPDQETLWSLASLIYEASRQVFPAAFKALEWLQRLAKQAHKQGSTSLVWNTPTNDTIHLVKYKQEMTDVYTTFNGKLSFGDWNKDNPWLEREQSSFVPSFVHSLDAALLKESFSDWQHPLSVIHDCVLVLPSDMDRAMDRLRDGFVSVASGDPLAALAEDLGVAAADLKRLEQGDQSLDCIYQSKYMFN